LTTPPDDAIVDAPWVLRWQADYCRHHNAPLAAVVCEAVAADAEAGGPMADALPGQVRMGDWLGLRVMGTVHRLAIDRKAPVVAMGAPTLGGTNPLGATDADTAVAAFTHAVVEALANHPDELARGLARHPQTNEPGRAGALRVALSRTTSPIRLVELGASAGLNLRADHLPGHLGLEAGPIPAVVERLGCDLNPVDPTTTDGRTWLSGFVWLYDTDRFADLAHALRVAANIPATVEQTDATTLVGGLDVADGTTTVVWHSALWPYLDSNQRLAVTGRLDELGARATPSAPLWHVTWEPGPTGPEVFELAVRVWDGGTNSGDRQVLVTGDSHGRRLMAT
jgi:hypothetical protein